MYKTILMAYDGSLEGRQALREGLLLGVKCGAALHLLAVTSPAAVPDGLGMPTLSYEMYQRVFDDGVARAREFGVPLTAKMSQGSPVREIVGYAKEIGADLIVVGHRRQSLLQRWWAGPDQQSVLSEHVPCSILIARNVVSDDAFHAALQALS